MNRLQKTALEGVGPGPRDLHRHEAPHQVFGAVEVHDPEVAGPAGHPPSPVQLLDQDLLDASHAGLVAPALPLLLAGVEDVKAAALLVFRDVVGQAEG
jgi:hypothetical protein